MGADWNESGSLLQNFATMDVYTSSNPSPDNAMLSGPFAYSWTGAGLNDINGTERDEKGAYLGDANSCHVLWSSGVEVPGAKRPATINFPAPGKVNSQSLVQWRPVNNRVSIANW